ncbi:MAG: DUF4321 domain-containing protein [Bacillota bacterium]
MARSFRSGGSAAMLFLLLLAGALIGGALEGLLPANLALLKHTASFGLQPSTLDLYFMKATFGFSIALGPLTALGLILGYLVWRRL